MASALTIDLFLDIVCPWCFVGTRRLDLALASVGEPDTEIVHRPFMLDPSAPPEGVDVRQMLRERYGAVDPGRLFGPVEAAARESGIPLDLTKQPRVYPTAAALTLLRLADQHGIGRLVAASLYSAYFLDGDDVSQLDVLVRIGTSHDISSDEVARVVRDEFELASTRRMADEATARGIRGVPYFIVGRRIAISGAQPVEVFRRAIFDATDETTSVVGPRRG
jgi:predicted DsbA family dithiol-disulfide isomerase